MVTNDVGDKHDGESSPETPAKKEQAVDLKVKTELSTIEGFEDWTLVMIRDFISCMDTARKRCTLLRQSKPEGQVKLVPLLLDDWRTLYPESSESVRTFLEKIKHLKSQKEEIKKALETSGLMPRVETDEVANDASGSGMYIIIHKLTKQCVDDRKSVEAKTKLFVILK